MEKKSTRGTDILFVWAVVSAFLSYKTSTNDVLVSIFLATNTFIFVLAGLLSATNDKAA